MTIDCVKKSLDLYNLMNAIIAYRCSNKKIAVTMNKETFQKIAEIIQERLPSCFNKAKSDTDAVENYFQASIDLDEGLDFGQVKILEI